MNNHETTSAVYRVKVGHMEIVVRARSVENAIAETRRQLVRDMPRLYDIIRSLESTKFEVRPAA